MRRTQYFHNKIRLDSSVLESKPSRKPVTLKEMNSTFKVPRSSTLPAGRINAKSVISPRRRVQSGRVKNNAKSIQNPKINFNSSMSFVNRKSMHCSSRGSQAKKELIAKLVYLAEATRKENSEKQFTPQKLVTNFTPRATPKCREYLILPELFKKGPNIEDTKSPLKDFIKRQPVSCSSLKKTPKFSERTLKLNKPSELNFSLEDNNVTSNLKLSFSLDSDYIHSILKHFQEYNNKATEIFDKIKILTDSFENDIKELPEVTVYNKFCFYQKKKQELHCQLQALEEKLISAFKNQENGCESLKEYFTKNRNLYDEQVKLHKDFEGVIDSALKKYTFHEKTNKGEEKDVTVKINEDKPVLRRSLRLSTLLKEEPTITKKQVIKTVIKTKKIQRPRIHK